MTNAISALKKAHQAQAITKDTHTLKEFYYKFEQNKKAVMDIVAIEAKYIAKFDKRNAAEGTEGAGSLGMRTRFYLKDGTTVGSFSNGSFRFFEFLASLLGYQNVSEQNFLHLDVTGNIKVEITIEQLDAKRSTYNFEVLEEGSEFNGLSDYLPTVGNVLALGNGVNPSTGELLEEVTTTAEEPAEEAPKGRTKK